MGDAAVTQSQAALLSPEKNCTSKIKTVPKTPASSVRDGKRTNSSSVAAMTAGGAAGCHEKGREEVMVAQQAPLKGRGGADDALPRSMSSVTQPDAPAGDGAAGAFAVPLEAETPRRPERRQELPPSRPPIIQTVGSNAESEVGSWEGAVEQAQSSPPPATAAATGSTCSRGRKLDLDAAAEVVAVGGMADEETAGAPPQSSTESAEASRPAIGSRPEEAPSSPRQTHLGEQTVVDDAGGGTGENGAGVAECTVHSPKGIGPERTASPGSLPPPGGSSEGAKEGAVAIVTIGGTGVTTPGGATSASSSADAGAADPCAEPDAAAAAAPLHVSTTTAAAAEGGEGETEQGTDSGNTIPFYRRSGIRLAASSRLALPSGGSVGAFTGGDMSAPFSPVSAGASGGISTARGRAGADAPGEPTRPSPGGGDPAPKAPNMLARFRSAARFGGSTSLFSRRATSAESDRPLPPAPDAGPTERARPSSSSPLSEAVGGGRSSTGGTNRPGFLSHKAALFESGIVCGKGGDALPMPMPAGGRAGKAPAFGGGGILGKTPLVSPLRSSSSSRTASVASSPAKPRREVEGDVEEGGARAATAAAAAAVAAADGGAAATGAATGPASGIVLPCAPTDEEKVLYEKTGRKGLVVSAVIAFVALSWGLWLFTLITPAFYWFGVPTTFVVFYTASHYFAVAIWGKDFDVHEHTEVVRRSEEKGYRPTVDVFLPVCKEPLHLLANTWRHVSALDYPDLKVFVLDDGKSDEVKALAATFGFEYVLRADAPALKKAGNLRNAFGRTSGEAIAIFDADFCPRPDFLKETVPYLGEDPSVGIVQTPQYFRHREEQTWIEQGAGVTQEYFYRMVQVNQDKFNAAVCVGSCGLYRRAALEPLGGMAAIEHSEDMYTGYRMTENGFKIKYVPLALAMGICPDEPQSFFMQQYRWCKGSTTLVAESGFWQSNISRIHKLCFLNGLLYYVATALLVFMAPVPILLLVWAEADGVMWYHSGFVLPSIVFASVVMPLWSKQPYGMACHRVKIIQCYAHMFAIKDSVMGRSAPWVPSGLGRSRLSSSAYRSSVRLLIGWNILITALIVGGSAWRMTELTWYHFLPAVGLAVGSFALNLSTLVY